MDQRRRELVHFLFAEITAQLEVAHSIATRGQAPRKTAACAGLALQLQSSLQKTAPLLTAVISLTDATHSTKTASLAGKENRKTSTGLRSRRER
jgi:hypothetical protein